MKINLALCFLCLLLISATAHADTLVVGTPADSYLATPTSASPYLGGAVINFDSLTPFTTYSTYTADGVSIYSPDGLEVLPYSTQSAPNELYDTSSDGTADITISLTDGTDAIGVGIADSDPVTIELQALGLGGTDLGSPFSITIPETGDNPGNGYYAIEDTSSDIYGLQITESVGSVDFSGLAIDDVQVAPEPGTIVLLLTGLLLMVIMPKRLLHLFRPEAGISSASRTGNPGLFPAA